MAISCDPNDLMEQAKCMKCIPSGTQNEVIIYLLAQINGGITDPNELMEAAKCFKCIPSGMQSAIITYLLCQNANGEGAGACTFLEGAGDPSGVNTPDFIGQLYHDTTADTYYRSTGLTSANWSLISGGGGPCANVEGAGDPT